MMNTISSMQQQSGIESYLKKLFVRHDHRMMASLLNHDRIAVMATRCKFPSLQNKRR